MKNIVIIKEHKKSFLGRSCKDQKGTQGKALAQLLVGGEKEATHACSKLANPDLSLGKADPKSIMDGSVMV